MDVNFAIIFTAVATFVTAIAASVAAYLSFRSAKAAERSVIHQKTTHNLAVMLEFVLGEYLEREFKATHAPKINGKEEKLLRAAKSKAMDEYKQNPVEWDEVSSLSNQDTWQNHVAFEIAWALEHLGASVFMGILPLDMVLGIVGETVIDDWLLCRSWVKSYRDFEGTISQVETTGVGDVDYHRRHAEWLVLVTVEWMRKNWQYESCDKVAQVYGGEGNLPPRIRSLSRVDEMLMPPIVKEQVKSLTGIRI